MLNQKMRLKIFKKMKSKIWNHKTIYFKVKNQIAKILSFFKNISNYFI